MLLNLTISANEKGGSSKIRDETPKSFCKHNVYARRRRRRRPGFFGIFFVAKHWKTMGGWELRFRDKGDKRKACKQRAKRVHERPFAITCGSSFVSRARSVNANGDRYVSATKAYEPFFFSRSPLEAVRVPCRKDSN